MSAPLAPDPDPGNAGDRDALALWAGRTVHSSRRVVGAVAAVLVYRRMSTEAWQDPVKSPARQREQAAASQTTGVTLGNTHEDLWRTRSRRSVRAATLAGRSDGCVQIRSIWRTTNFPATPPMTAYVRKIVRRLVSGD